MALCRASREVLGSPQNSFGIFSDSQSSLEAVTNRHSFHPLVMEIRNNLRHSKISGKNVELFWIKAHAGLTGNKRADELAKEAALRLKTKPDYDRCPISFVKRRIRSEALDEWNHRYRSGETAAITKWFLPDAIQAYKIVKQLQPTGVTTQIMTGHGGFSEYLNRFKRKESPSCICDPSISESVPHIILDCPTYGSERYELEQRLKTQLKRNNICEIMTDKKNEKVL